ncbi:MAG TPA: WYL domain-containing protein [Kineosporiaceae bacterium]|jgi:predicted DNA-binding transcriptional regulator YafY|nr:WYL domain-containing protein [Kineosporiaceae bacterium]
MAPQRTERLLNLVIALVATRRWLTKEQIRRAVPQYADCETAEAFDRMFERDKEDLRELGVPLVTGTESSLFDDEQGYRIDRDAYPLPEIAFTGQELAVLGLASRVWQQASLAGPAARAMTKLRALGVEVDTESLIGVEPRVRAAEPAFDPMYAATRDRAPVRFRYRKPDGEITDRRVEPWALTSTGGHWYVVGRDVDRGAARAFRLSRVQGAVRAGRPGGYEIPADLDAAALVGPPTVADARTAVLRVRPGRGTALRLQATSITQADGPDGWDLVELPVRDLWVLAEQAATHGPDVVVLAPQDLREATVKVLTGALAAHPAPSAVPVVPEVPVVLR